MNDNNLMQILYDYLDAMFIGADKTQNNGAVLQLLPLGTAINPKDFANPISAVNFDEGSLASAENFAQLVNDIPVAQPKFVSQGKLEDVYGWILGNAVAVKEQDLDEEAKKRYEEAYNLLNTKVEKNGRTVFVPSQELEEYNNALADYEDAVSTRSMESLEADHTNPKGQKLWSLRKKKLDGEVKRAYDKVSRYVGIKNALDIVKTTYAEGVKGMVAKEKEFFSSSAQTSDIGKEWHLCSAYPSNWYENDDMYTSIKIDGSSMKDQSSSKCLSVGGEASLNVGIFSGSASAEHKKEEAHSDSETNISGIQLDIAAVRIERSWLNETLFALDGWKIAGHGKGHISDGTFVTEEGKKHNEGIMPLIPKYMLIARNITLTGEFSKDIQDRMSKETTANTSIGVGPFKAKGHVESNEKEENVEANCDKSSITIVTPQVIGYISSIVKMSPKNE